MHASPLSPREALDRIRATSEVAADDVIDALRWMGDDGATTLSRAALQQFLWYELPFKWLGGPVRHTAVARALRRYFDLVGYARYAAVCDDPFTAEQATRFAVGEPREAYRAFVRHHDNSGVVPPDTSALSWGELMGEREFDAFWQVAMGLELAVEAGIVVPGRARWRTEQRDLVVALLDQPRPSSSGPGRAGRSLRDEVEQERIERWLDADGPGRARAHVLEPVAPLLALAAEPPRGARAALAPMRWLTSLPGLAGAGLPLTATGALPRAVAEEAAARFAPRLGAAPRPDGSGPVVRREADLPGLGALRAVAERGGLLAVRSGRLRSAAADEPVTTWAGVVRGLVPSKGIDAELWPVLLALRLGEGRDRAEHLRVAGVVAAERATGRSRGVPPDRSTVEASVDRLDLALTALGALALRSPGRGPGRAESTADSRPDPRAAGRSTGPRTSRPGPADPALTVAGTALALAALRSVAVGPSRA